MKRSFSAFSLICFLAFSTSLFSQFDYLSVNPNKIMMYYNPAYTGVKSDINFVSQYEGEIEVPESQSFHIQIDGRLPFLMNRKQVNLSLGAIYHFSEYGRNKTQGNFYSLSNAFVLKKGHRLSVGIRYSYERAEYGDSYSDYTQVYKWESTAHGIGGGTYFESAKKKLYGGVSFDYYAGESKQENQPARKLRNGYRISSSLAGRIKLGKILNVEPSIISISYLTDYSSISQLQFGAKLFVKEMAYFGTSFSYQGRLSFIAGGRFGWQKVGFFELGAASYLPFYGYDESGVAVYLNYFFLSKNNKEAINYN